MNKLSIEVLSAEDLSEEMKDAFDVKYDDRSNYMIVEHDSTPIMVVSDYMEPEDATFFRDLKWVAELLIEVYELGKKDGDDLR